MSVTYLPSPSRGSWQLGPIPVRAYALCIVLGILVAVWVADRRYRRAGGLAGVIVGIAIWAVPSGLAGARLYSVATDYELYFGAGRDWVNIFRISGGGIGIAGAVAAGAAGAWLACRRAGVSLVPVAGAAAPAIAFGQAVGRWGNWFNQELYGRPSALPWAVEIDPAHRIPGYENYATFQPAFLYESLWDVAVAVAVIWAARRFLLTGDRAFALYAGLYAVGRYGTETVRIDYAHHLLGLRVSQWLMIAVLAAAVAYLYLTRAQRGPDAVAHPAPAGLPGRPAAAGPAVTATAAPGPAAERRASGDPPESGPATPSPAPPSAPGQAPLAYPEADHIECF